MAYTTKGALDRQKAVTVKSKEKNNDVRLQLFAEDWRVWDAVLEGLGCCQKESLDSQSTGRMR